MTTFILRPMLAAEGFTVGTLRYLCHTDPVEVKINGQVTCNHARS